MLDLWLMLIFGLVLSIVFLLLPFLFSFFSKNPEKSLPIESGFMNLVEGVSHFNNQFFVILVIFVIFDLEVILSICFVCSEISSSFLWELLFFMVITLILEWWYGKINWGD